MPIVKPAALVVNMLAAALLLSLFYLRVETPVVGFPNELASGRTVDTLVGAAAWQQGSPFRGRVLAVRHADQAAPLTTEILSDPWINDEDLDWTLLALKEHQVPTLAPYGQLISPGLLRVSRDLFGVAGDALSRNEIVTRRLTLESARLFGVRFAIADAPLRVPGTTELVKLSGSPDLYVYEIMDANVAGLSPTNVITSADWRGTLSAMTAPDFVADRDVVVDVDAAEDLVDLQPVSSSSIILSGYDITVTAETRGRSLLVLPFEFSHCLDASASDGGFVRLQPVDGILTGVVFEGSGNVRITALGAPWSRAACRLHDRSWWREMFGPKLLAGQSTYVAAVKR